MASNTNQQTLQQSSRLDFLYEASYSIFSKCPSLSRYYMNEFQNTLTEYELTLPKPVQRSACTSCGQIYIPGLNAKVDIVTIDELRNKKSIKKKQRKSKSIPVKKNKIQYTCLACQRAKVYNGSFKQKIPKNIIKNTKVPATTTTASTVNTASKIQLGTVTKSATTTTAVKSNPTQHTATVTTSAKVTKTVTTTTTVQNRKVNKNDKAAMSVAAEAFDQKKKKNKGKKNSLKALLAKQQQQQNANQGSSLNDFLSSL